MTERLPSARVALLVLAHGLGGLARHAAESGDTALARIYATESAHKAREYGRAFRRVHPGGYDLERR